MVGMAVADKHGINLVCSSDLQQSRQRRIAGVDE